MASCHSIVEFTLDGILTGPYAFTFDTLPADTVAIANQIEVYVGAELLTITTDYTVNPSTKEVTLVDPHDSGDILSIKRKTKIDDRYIDFVNGAVLTEQILDLDSNQLFFLIQENFCEQANSLKLLGNCWNGQGYTTCNFAAGTTNNSLVTLGQVINLIAGINPINVGGVNYVSYTGDGATTEFNIDSFNYSAIQPTHDFFVTVDNILQDSDVAYSVVQSGPNQVIKFGTAPINGAKITIRSVTGSVVAQSVPGSITGTSLKDKTVDISKLVDQLDNSVWSGSGNFVVLRAAEANLNPFSWSETSWVPMELDYTAVGDFNTGVRLNRLDQMANPTENINLNNNRIINLSNPSAAGDATTKAYVDAAILGIGTPTPEFLEATQFDSFEASVNADGGLPQSGTLSVKWGDHPGPVLIRIQPSHGNSVYTPALQTQFLILHFDQATNSGSSSLGGDGILNGATAWVGDYFDNTSGIVAEPQSNFAGYRINSAGTDLWFWINVTSTQISWSLGDSTRGFKTDANEYFQVRMAFWRKEF